MRHARDSRDPCGDNRREVFENSVVEMYESNPIAPNVSGEPDAVAKRVYRKIAVDRPVV
jgi:hypothetical protein